MMAESAPESASSRGSHPTINCSNLSTEFPRLITSRPSLSGSFFDGEEKGTTHAFAFHGSHAINLRDFARYANVELSEGDGVIGASTPLGDVDLEPSDLISYQRDSLSHSTDARREARHRGSLQRAGLRLGARRPLEPRECRATPL